MHKYLNGFLIQDMSWVTNIVRTFNYKGINAYDNFPLRSINTQKCREITDKISISEVSNGVFEIHEFISNEEDLKNYIQICRELSVPIRALFLESEYCGEIWRGSLPQTKLVGYEYCPLPIDDIIITDLDWCPHIRKHVARLNEYGLFQTEEDAVSFRNDYLKAQSDGDVGDGDVEAYIFKVSIVDL